MIKLWCYFLLKQQINIDYVVLQFKNIEELVDNTVPVDIRFQGEMDIKGSKGKVVNQFVICVY